MNKELNEQQNAYKIHVCKLFTDNGFTKMISYITPAISTFLECVKLLSKQNTKEHIILMDSNKNLLKYTVLLFEVSRCQYKYIFHFNHTCAYILGVKMEVSQSISYYKQDTSVS